MSGPASGSLDCELYRPHVPRFIHQNFSPPLRLKGKKKQKRGSKLGLFVNAVSFGGEAVDPRLERHRHSVATDAPPDSFYGDALRILLSIETEVAEILGSVKDAAEQGENVLLTRDQVDQVRKFVILQKYWGENYSVFDQYPIMGRETEGYFLDSPMEYARIKELKNPAHFWSHNIKTFAKIHIDTEGQWEEALRSQMYRPHAEWFIRLFTETFLSFCKPSVEDDEFILTRTACWTSEGSIDSQDHWSYAYHLMVPISPKLMVVLRSNYLPGPRDDPTLCQVKSRVLDTMRRPRQTATTLGPYSALPDLAVDRAASSFEIWVGQRRVGRDVAYRGDKIAFETFHIPSHQVQTINSVMLEKVDESLYYVSQPALLRALDFYLSLPCTAESPFKRLARFMRPMLTKLRKLHQVARQLSSEATLEYAIYVGDESLLGIEESSNLKGADFFREAPDGPNARWLRKVREPADDHKTANGEEPAVIEAPSSEVSNVAQASTRAATPEPERPPPTQSAPPGETDAENLRGATGTSTFAESQNGDATGVRRSESSTNRIIPPPEDNTESAARLGNIEATVTSGQGDRNSGADEPVRQATDPATSAAPHRADLTDLQKTVLEIHLGMLSAVWVIIQAIPFVTRCAFITLDVLFFVAAKLVWLGSWLLWGFAWMILFVILLFPLLLSR